MPIIGWYLGQTLVQYIQKYDHWVALFSNVYYSQQFV
ncbi:manganese efflux pump [Candidatus Riflebacteria bacterium]